MKDFEYYRDYFIYNWFDDVFVVPVWNPAEYWVTNSIDGAKNEIDQIKLETKRLMDYIKERVK